MRTARVQNFLLGYALFLVGDVNTKPIPSSSTLAAPCQKYPLLINATIEMLMAGLHMNHFTSVDLVNVYLARIAQVNSTLHVVTEVNPDALEIARQLDNERSAGTIRGPLHGIPILIKYNIGTNDKMNTTAGSYALLGAKLPRDSTVVEKLRSIGAVILGKTNLSQWANYRSNNSSNGWSALGGQVYGAYYPEQDPNGSSSGSAVASSLGLALGSLGSETDGSIISPSSFNNVVGIKPTVGLTSRNLVIPVSEHQDTVGPLARTVKDAAIILQAIAGVDPYDNYTSAIPNNGSLPDYVSACNFSALSGARIGIPRNAIALRADETFVPQIAAFEKAISTLEAAGATIVDNTNFTAAAEFVKSASETQVLNADFLVNLASYLALLTYNPTMLTRERAKFRWYRTRLHLLLGSSQLSMLYPVLISILTALFYGSLANSHGRRFVMRIATTGQLLALVWIVLVYLASNNAPVELIWLSSLFLVLGGGTRLELSMQYTSFCDVVSWTTRTRSLFFFHATDGLAGLLGPPISSALMKYRLWAPFGMAFEVFMMKYVLLWYIPETSPYLTAQSAEGSIILRSDEASDSEENDTTNSTRLVSDRQIENTSNRWLESLYSQTLNSRLWNFFGHRGLNIVFGCFIVKRISFASEAFIFQYASELLHKKIFEMFWLRTFNHLSMMLVLGIFLPLITRTLISPTKDIWVIRGSLLDIVVGFLILWNGHSFLALCIGMAVCGFGEGLEVGLQSLGSYIVGEANHATFFTFASILGVAGELLGGPIMARAYTHRNENNLPAGYMFLLSAVLFGCLFISSYLVKTTRL